MQEPPRLKRLDSEDREKIYNRDSEMPEVVCLCGSTKFKDAYRSENRRLTMDGKIVISVGLFGHADGHDLTEAEKGMLDKLHKRKIDLADRIHVIDLDGYVGDSTQSEIKYARETGKDVSWYEPPKNEELVEPGDAILAGGGH